MSLLPSSNRRLDIRPGGRDPGPDGDGKCLVLPIPGLGALLGGVARPKPLSVSAWTPLIIINLLLINRFGIFDDYLSLY